MQQKLSFPWKHVYVLPPLCYANKKCSIFSSSTIICIVEVPSIICHWIDSRAGRIDRNWIGSSLTFVSEYITQYQQINCHDSKITPSRFRTKHVSYSLYHLHIHTNTIHIADHARVGITVSLFKIEIELRHSEFSFIFTPPESTSIFNWCIVRLFLLHYKFNHKQMT